LAHSPRIFAAVLAALLAATARGADAPPPEAAIINPAIDAGAYLRIAFEAMRMREERRLSEAEFIRMSREPGTVVLDARSKAKFDEMHLEGAINLSFPDIATLTLAATLPDKSVRILIYCNNNFRNAEGPFPSKLPSASLNLSTWVALFDYGYRNVWELAPLVDVEATALVFEPSPQTPR
jgi:phage shock protein E